MIRFTSIVQRANKTWLFNWVDTAPPLYRIILFGREIDKTLAPPYNFQLPGWERFPPPIEVVEGDAKSLSETYQPFLILQWYQVLGSAFYQVDEKTSPTVWTKRATVVEGGSPVYTLKTPRLADGSTHVYRVSAGDLYQQLSAKREFDIKVVTPPYFMDTSYRVGYDKTSSSLTVVARA